MKPKQTIGIIAAIIVVVVLGVLLMGGFGKNDDQNWQIKQSIGGTVTVIDTPGWYYKGFASVWTYPRATQRYFSESDEEGGNKDESIMVTFNDGGQAKISTMIRFQTPVKMEDRRKLHQDFSGNPENVTHAIRSHLTNCMKAAAPLMSASENQSARKSEFTQIIQEQLVAGLYEMRKVEKVLPGKVDETGEPVTVIATLIVYNKDADGNDTTPKIAQKSPLQEYGIEILQFSVTGTNYDKQTREQFAAKKKSFLAAEQSKAEREQEVQQRLMVVEKGLREKAEVTASGNVEKESAIIKATKEKEMAEIEAAQKVAVEEQAKLEAETKANKVLAVSKIELETAKIKLQTADEEAKAIIVLAEAKEQEIQRAGMITEKEKTLAEIAAKRDAEVSKYLSALNVPRVTIGGSGANGGGTMENLINLKLLEATGILDGDGNLKPMKKTIMLPPPPRKKK